MHSQHLPGVHVRLRGAGYCYLSLPHMDKGGLAPSILPFPADDNEILPREGPPEDQILKTEIGCGLVKQDLWQLKGVCKSREMETAGSIKGSALCLKKGVQVSCKVLESCTVPAKPLPSQYAGIQPFVLSRQI